MAQLMKEVSGYLCYEATADLLVGVCPVTTRLGVRTNKTPSL